MGVGKSSSDSGVVVVIEGGAVELSTEKWSNRGRTVCRDCLVESCKLLLVRTK